MATRPTPGGSDGTWGTELNEHLDVSLDTDGKVDDGAAQTTSAAPTADAELANKKYVDDNIGSANYTPTTESGAAGSTGETVFPNGLRIAYGSESIAAGAEDTITLSGWTAVYSAVATWNEDDATDRYPPKISNISTASFHIRSTSGATLTAHWMAIGY